METNLYCDDDDIDNMSELVILDKLPKIQRPCKVYNSYF